MTSLVTFWPGRDPSAACGRRMLGARRLPQSARPHARTPRMPAQVPCGDRRYVSTPRLQQSAALVIAPALRSVASWRLINKSHACPTVDTGVIPRPHAPSRGLLPDQNNPCRSAHVQTRRTPSCLACVTPGAESPRQATIARGPHTACLSRTANHRELAHCWTVHGQYAFISDARICKGLISQQRILRRNPHTDNRRRLLLAAKCCMLYVVVPRSRRQAQLSAKSCKWFGTRFELPTWPLRGG